MPPSNRPHTRPATSLVHSIKHAFACVLKWEARTAHGRCRSIISPAWREFVSLMSAGVVCSLLTLMFTSVIISIGFLVTCLATTLINTLTYLFTRLTMSREVCRGSVAFSATIRIIDDYSRPQCRPLVEWSSHLSFLRSLVSTVPVALFASLVTARHCHHGLPTSLCIVRTTTDLIRSRCSAQPCLEMHWSSVAHIAAFQGCSLGLERLGLETVSRRFLNVSVSSRSRYHTSRLHRAS